MRYQETIDLEAAEGAERSFEGDLKNVGLAGPGHYMEDLETFQVERICLWIYDRRLGNSRK